MNKTFLIIAIIGVAGILTIAGIVAYQFILEQMKEQKAIRIKTDLANYSLQQEWETKFDAYFKETQATCGLDKACYDASYKKNGLADPKFDVIDGDLN